MAPPINVQDWYGDRHTCQIASGALGRYPVLHFQNFSGSSFKLEQKYYSDDCSLETETSTHIRLLTACSLTNCGISDDRPTPRPRTTSPGHKSSFSTVHVSVIVMTPSHGSDRVNSTCDVYVGGKVRVAKFMMS